MPFYTFPIANFPVEQNGQPILTTFRTGATLSSRWQTQFGIRYHFNWAVVVFQYRHCAGSSLEVNKRPILLWRDWPFFYPLNLLIPLTDLFCKLI